MNNLFSGGNSLPGPSTPSLNLARKIFKGLASKSEIDEYMKEYASFGEKRMGKPMMLMSWDETITCRVINENNKEGDLEGGDCPLCKNRGFTYGVQDGYEYIKECECVEKRRTLGKVENSEYATYITSKKFSNFEILDGTHSKALEKAKAFMAQKKYPFLFVAGNTGTGKTHLTVATFFELVQFGYDNHFVKWESEFNSLKTEQFNDTVSYRKRLNRLKYSELLLIDDIFYNADGATPTAYEFKLVKEILDERSIRGLKTIMSSNYTLEKLFNLNPVVGGRISEFTGGQNAFALTLNGENYRKRDLLLVGDIEGF